MKMSRKKKNVEKRYKRTFGTSSSRSTLDSWTLSTYGKRARFLTEKQKKTVPDYVRAEAWNKEHKYPKRKRKFGPI